jgi:hypothetical protein
LAGSADEGAYNPIIRRERMKSMKKLILGLLMCALMSAPAVATITITPDEQGVGRDWTYQEWTFTTQPASMTDIEADVDQNPYGTPTADIALTGFIPPPGWYPDTYDGSGRTGVILGWTATIDLVIPNFERPPPWHKIIQVEVAYHVETYVPGQHGYIDASSYVTAGGINYGDEYSSVNDEDLGGGWHDVTITWSDLPQPSVEVIHLYFVDTGVVIDSIEVATVCVPEPATLLLLGGAGLVGWLRRRRA